MIAPVLYGAGAPGARLGLAPFAPIKIPCLTLEPRARGTPDAQRVRSLVRVKNKHTSVVTTVTPKTSGVPHAVVLTACFAKNPRQASLSNPPL